MNLIINKITNDNHNHYYYYKSIFKYNMYLYRLYLFKDASISFEFSRLQYIDFFVLSSVFDPETKKYSTFKISFNLFTSA